MIIVKKIHSKINKKIIHILYSKKDFFKRTDIIDINEFLQVASIELNKYQTFKPHKHIWKKTTYDKTIAQECWIIISGSIEVSYYDIDGGFLESNLLYAGDCTITLEGGHNYKSLEDGTSVYEVKTGPYLGQINDKEFI